MINAATILIADWYKRNDFGINKMLESVPRFQKGNSGAKFKAPPPVTVYDDVRDKVVAGELEPPESPAIVVFSDSDTEITFGNEHARQSGSGLIVVTAYMVRDVGDAAEVGLHAGFTLRAARRSLTRLNTPKISDPLGGREWNSLSLSKIEKVTEQRVMGAVGESTLVGFLLATVWMLDKET